MATDAQPQRDASHETDHDRSGFERFLNNFLQESNIKWILLIGVAIVAGCSLMLVTQKWSGWPVTLKYLTVLSYTAATYTIAELCEKRLGLRTTSQVLKLLTVILIPIGFLALAALAGETDSMRVGDSMLTLLMMIPATAFMGYAADRIFQYWLHGRQLTFLAAYMLLSLAGALPVINQTWLAILFSCGFWVVMTLGVLKVNRHLFWLAEEHRWPRIYGFAPIAILGAQLIALLTIKTIGALPIHWLGLGFAMLAATILMTTRTIASVFRQRTGDLVRPLPMSLIVPLFTGLLLIATGVLFSFHGFHFVGETTRAVVPTALASAVLLLIVAKDTRHQAFVWAGLILITIAYQSTPTLLGPIVQTLKSAAASGLHETRLPVAFYGVTYLPLMLLFAIAGRWLHDQKWSEFSVPFMRFTTCMSVLLIALSVTHVKAAFIVAAISMATFTVYAVLFRERAYLAGSLVSLLIATGTCVPFANHMQWVECDVRWVLVAYAIAGLILAVSKTFDRLSLRFPTQDTRLQSGRPWIQYLGRATLLITSIVWLFAYAVVPFVSPLSSSSIAQWMSLAICVLGLAVWTLQTKHYVCGLWTWSVVAGGAWLWLFAAGIPLSQSLAWVGLACGSLSIVAYAYLRNRKIDISLGRFAKLQSNESFVQRERSTALVLPLADVAMAHFASLIGVFYLPAMLWATASLDLTAVPAMWMGMAGLSFAAAAIFRGPLATVSSVLFAPVVAGIAVGQWMPSMFTYGNLPLVYAVTSSMMASVMFWRTAAPNKQLARVCSLWLYGLIGLGFVYLTPLTLVSALVALATVYFLAKSFINAEQKSVVVILASSLLILSLTMLSGYRGITVGLLWSPEGPVAAGWGVLGIIAALILFDRPWKSLCPRTMANWSLVLRALAVVWGVVCFITKQPVWLESLVIVGFVIAAINELRIAIREQSQWYVHSGFAVIAAVVVWLHLHHVMAMSPSIVRLILLAGAGLAMIFAKLWQRHERLAILVPSLQRFVTVIPAVIVMGSLVNAQPTALESLLMFGSAMIWFVFGRLNKMNSLVIAAAVTMNLGLGRLWYSLSLTDAQFYLVPLGLTVIGLVELLRRDIHEKAHDPLRYVGALLVLASPCFDILGGSWLHILSLMILSVLIVLMAIGLRLRALVHAGTAFLAIDLVAMVVRSTIDHPGMLWAIGLLVGVVVISIAAFCERHREQVLGRIRLLSAQLATWN